MPYLTATQHRNVPILDWLSALQIRLDMGARKPEGVRRSARIQGSKANPIDLTAPTPSPKSRVTKSKAPPKTKQATKRDCATCGRILSTQSFPKHITDDCNHDVNTCKACVKAWIPAQLDSVTYDKLSCPECPSILQNADVQKHAAKAVYDRFDELERRGIAETVPGWRWCMNPDCRAGQVHEPLLEVAANAGGKGTKAKGKKKKSAEDDICECKECGAKVSKAIQFELMSCWIPIAQMSCIYVHR